MQLTNPALCIAGHSRGGAVATSVLAALLGGKLKKGGQDKLKKGSTLGLLLIDPVDDGATTSLRQLSQTLEELGSSTPVPVKTLIVSTSFGGYSSYYKTKIANACAPEQRNAPAFRDSFAKLRLASGMTYLDAPELGHLQLLDEAVLGSPYSSACARNAAPVEGRRQKVHEQISLWLRSLFS
ncbi:hypothetical protein B484DRAFT_399079 [Ochromonadaceae sp. CCMP2298]|nr:hypothetical protein B484DRAFT_399079 [Ochromonadaceae sp. CCMP2298]